MSHLRGVTINAVLAATPPVVLAIAAHDPLGGAGLAADLTTFAAFGVHGTVAVTAVTAQHLRSVDRVEPMDSGLVADQIDAIADTFSIAGVKTGLLGSAAIVEVVADRIEAGVLPAPVVDPVLVDGRGHRFVGEEIEQAYRERLLPAAVAITPNLGEASLLAGRRWRASSTSTQSLTNSPALAPPMWSSPADPTAAPAVDVLVRADGTIDHLESPWIDTVHVRGSGARSQPRRLRPLLAARMRSTRSVRRRRSSRIGCGPRSGSISVGRPGCPLDLRVSGPVLAESVGEPQSTCSHSSP